MRHRILLLASGAAFAVLGAMRPALAAPPLKFSVAGGYTWLAGSNTLEGFWKSGPVIGASVLWRAATRLGVNVEAAVSWHGYDAAAYASILAMEPQFVNGNTVTIVPITVGAEYALLAWGNTRPYVAGSLGYCAVRTSDAQWFAPQPGSVPKLHDDAFLVRGGAGIRTLLTPSVSLFADVMLHYAWTRPEAIEFVPVHVGVRF